MGGNALKNYKTKRCTTEELFLNQNEIISLLKKHIPKIKASGVNFYNDKNDHGDIDIVIALDELDLITEPNHLGEPIKAWYTLIDKIFTPNDGRFGYNKKEESKNSIYSFDYHDIQIDLIKVAETDFDFAKNYYSYNDMMGLISNVYHGLGFKFGFDGLKIMQTFDDAKDKPIYLTKDIKEALEFGGYDYDRFLQGFENKEEGFAYVKSSKYFSPHFYHKDQRQSRDSYRRDKKRKMMNLFLNELKKDNFKILYKPNKEKEFLRAEDFFGKEKIFQQREKNNKLYSKEKLQEKQIKYFSSLDFFNENGLKSKKDIKDIMLHHLNKNNMQQHDWSTFIFENYKNPEKISKILQESINSFYKKNKKRHNL